MDLEIHADSAEAEATLYIFVEKTARPVILTWTGSIGEEISFDCEV